MSAYPQETQSGFIPKLFEPDLAEATEAEKLGLSSSMTLCEFFEAYVAKSWLKERHDSAKTMGLYRDALKHWKHFTGDPPLKQIDDFHTAEFIGGLFTLPGRGAEFMAPATVDKHRRAIQTCLRLAGPRNEKAKKGQRLLSEVPFLEPVHLDDPDVDDDFTLAEIEKILAVCHLMRLPKLPGVKPVNWWQSLIILAFNTGERRGALLGVTYADLTFDERRGALLCFPRTIRKGQRKRNKVPLNAAALQAIEKIRTPRELIFPWKNWPKNTKWFETNWKRLLAMAGIPEERQFGIHSIRKTTGTAVFNLNPAAAQLLLGHSDMATTQKFYVNQGVVRAAVDELQQPEFDPDPQQLALFDLSQFLKKDSKRNKKKRQPGI